MDKEKTIQIIKERIISERRKHKNIDWEEIAARKIYSSLEKLFAILVVRHSAYKKPPMPQPNDYYESSKEANEQSTRVPLMTWKEEYEMDLKEWERHYA